MTGQGGAAAVAGSDAATAARQALAGVDKLIDQSDTMPAAAYVQARGDAGMAAASALRLLLAEIDRQAGTRTRAAGTR